MVCWVSHPCLRKYLLSQQKASPICIEPIKVSISSGNLMLFVWDTNLLAPVN